eukprot:g2940.t1
MGCRASSSAEGRGEASGQQHEEEEQRYVTSDAADEVLEEEVTPTPTDGGEKQRREEMEAWLLDVGLIRYRQKLWRNGFDSLRAVSMIEEQDLEEIGLKRGHMRVFLKEAEKLRGTEDEKERSSGAKKKMKTTSGSKQLKVWLKQQPCDLSVYLTTLQDAGWDSMEALLVMTDTDVERLLPKTKRGHVAVFCKALMDLRFAQRSAPTRDMVSQPQVREILSPLRGRSIDREIEPLSRDVSELSPLSRLKSLEAKVQALRSETAFSQRHAYVLSGRSEVPTKERRYVGEGKWKRWESFQDTAERYDAALDVWTDVSVPPLVGRGGGASLPLQDGTFSVVTIQGTRWSPSQGIQTMAPPIVEKRAWGDIDAAAGHVYAVGGFGNSGLTQVVEQYSIAKDEWRPMAPLRIARHSLCLLGKAGEAALYVTGGGSSRKNRAMVSVECYDAVLDKWSAGPDLPTPVLGHASCWHPLVGGLISTGGTNGEAARLREAHFLDPRIGRWDSLGSMIYPRAFHGCSLLPNGYGVLLCGGKEGQEWARHCEIFETRMNRFRIAASLKNVRHAVPHPSFASARRRPRGYAVVVI